LLQVEQRYIDELLACDVHHGFNIAPRAGSRRGVKQGTHSKEHREKIGAANKLGAKGQKAETANLRREVA
jgi:hypothetical protein